jgi:hypothetical protein
VDIEFDCVHCKQHLSVDPSAAGQQAECPTCGNAVTVPAQEQNIPPPHITGGMMFCSKCGQQNSANNVKCARCGFVLHGPSQPTYVVTDDSTMGGLIPYKNARALWAYYFGVFSFIPCIGIPLGIAALILGIKGLKFAELHPTCGGKAHSWTGIILGTICAIVYTLAITVLAFIGTRH